MKLHYLAVIGAALMLGACYAYPETRLDAQQNGAIFAQSRSNYSCRVGGLLTRGGPGCIGKKLGSKNGQACHNTLLSLFSWGSKSTTTAMQSAGITVPQAIDYSDIAVLRVANLLPAISYAWNISLFNRECVHVNGD